MPRMNQVFSREPRKGDLSTLARRLAVLWFCRVEHHRRRPGAEPRLDTAALLRSGLTGGAKWGNANASFLLGIDALKRCAARTRCPGQ
jgi:hypothetical protein